MLIKDIHPEMEKVLIQPTNDNSSSFTTETKKYDRKAIGIVKAIGPLCEIAKEGDLVVYDDTGSIDFVIDGVALTIIDEFEIVAKIYEESK